MHRLDKILSTYPNASYVISAVDLTVLVANRTAEEMNRQLTCFSTLTGVNLVEILNSMGLAYDTHPGVRTRLDGGVHSRYYEHRRLMVVASRLPDVPTRPPAILVTCHQWQSEEPLAVAEHLRIVGAFQVANALDDAQRNMAVAMRMMDVAQERLRDLGDLWYERIEAYAPVQPEPFAELSLLDAANERSERLPDIPVDLSVVASTVRPLQQRTV